MVTHRRGPHEGGVVAHGDGGERRTWLTPTRWARGRASVSNVAGASLLALLMACARTPSATDGPALGPCPSSTAQAGCNPVPSAASSLVRRAMPPPSASTSRSSAVPSSLPSSAPSSPVAPSALATAAPPPPDDDLTYTSAQGFDLEVWLREHGVSAEPGPCVPGERSDNPRDCIRGFRHAGRVGVLCDVVYPDLMLIGYRVCVLDERASGLRVALDVAARFSKDDYDPEAVFSVALEIEPVGDEVHLTGTTCEEERRNPVSEYYRWAWRRICKNEGRYAWRGHRLVRVGSLPDVAP